LNLKFTPARRRFSVKPTLTLNSVPAGKLPGLLSIGRSAHSSIAEIYVTILKFGRPVLRKRPLRADTCGPTGLRSGGRSAIMRNLQDGVMVACMGRSPTQSQLLGGRLLRASARLYAAEVADDR